MKEAPPQTRRMSYFLFAIVSAMLVLSIMALYQAVESYTRKEILDYGSIMLSITAIALSSYMLIQMRKKPLKLGFEMQKVSTTIQCTSCDFKNSRDFQRGDYILKEAGTCPKCNNLMIISAIYREVEEKESE